MSDQSEGLDWRDGDIPVSRRFNDPYYSLENGLAETRHVFLQGNDLPTRLCVGFHVAELGVGTALNLLALEEIWTGPGQIHYTGFEAFPLTRAQLERALMPFFPKTAAPLISAWSEDGFSYETDQLKAQMIVGDARQTVKAWAGRADAWFLDGFAPAKNPELWEPELLSEVARHTNPGGSFATYTAAGAVRRDLDAAGFNVKRVPGFGRKKHMTKGTL